MRRCPSGQVNVCKTFQMGSTPILCSIVKSGYGCYPSDIKINQLVNFALFDIKQEEWHLEVLARKKLPPALGNEPLLGEGKLPEG